jgi:hypothetical protein
VCLQLGIADWSLSVSCGTLLLLDLPSVCWGRYWENPEVIEKFSKVMEGAFDFGDPAEEEEEDPEEGEADDLHHHASMGMI